MSVSPIEVPGLRERKRRATRRAIQLAVIDLVAERGLDGTTVDEISRRADISPRTFFNYFTSKEDAAVGEIPPLPAPELIDAFVAAGPSGSVLDGLASIIVETIGMEGQDQELMHRRKELLKQHPHLFAMRIARMRQLEEELGRVVAQRLLADDPGLDPRAAESRGRLMANVAFAVLRHAWVRWAADERAASLDDRVSESFAELRELFASDAAHMG